MTIRSPPGLYHANSRSKTRRRTSDDELIFRPPSQRSAALKLDWAKVTTSLGLRGQTVSGLQAFKKRNDDARRKVQMLAELPTSVDFAQYRGVLKNQAVVDEIQKRFTAFKPATYDLNRQLKAIEAFEVEAVRNAEATKEKVDLELKDLEKTLMNIEEARPFEDLTVVCHGLTNRSNCLEEVTLLITENRTKSLLPSRRSTRRPPSSFPRDAGRCQDTRYVFYEHLETSQRLIAMTGKIRRSLHPIDNLTVPSLLCTLAM